MRLFQQPSRTYFTPEITLMDWDLETRQPHKKQRRSFESEADLEEMAFFAPSSVTQYLQPAAPSRKRSQRFRQPDDVEDFLSSDLEVSFASTVSLNSPPHGNVALVGSDDFAMDISPMPPTRSTAAQAQNGRGKTRPRALTSGARLFGSDLSNSMSSPQLEPSPSFKSAGTTMSRKTQRSALPLEWMMASRSPEPSEIEPLPEPQSPADDAMDIDSSYAIDSSPERRDFARAPRTADPTVVGFDTLFFGTMSPRRSLDAAISPEAKKRRSLSPEPLRSFEHEGSSSPIASSPSQLKLERMVNAGMTTRLNKPTLQGLGAPCAQSRRSRRPVLSAMVNPSDLNPLQSAYPVLTSNMHDENSPKGSPPVRRAFSALIAPSTMEPSSDESFDGPDMSSPAQAYAKRQQVKTIRRCDGTEDFRPLTGATAMVLRDSPSSRFFTAGMPGFGDNEAYGKILPCHRVREDGLMRISSQTLNQLLDGNYDDKINNFYVIDCRFDYEYAGGHIPRAININTTAGVEEFLFSANANKPAPSTSGDSVRKTILVFHCEFSAKRAPTFAKHLRAKDRAMNNHIYPKIHFPEVYILEGGYCQYFKTSPHRCEPQGYVTMDDPTHAASRREDLDQFRKAKFGRHKSYTYGDGPGKTSLVSQPQTKRNTVPTGGPNSLFAAANAARTRRGGSGSGLSTLPEDSNATADGDDTDTDIGDSPCPPPTKTNMFKGKKLGRVPLIRAETYNAMHVQY